MGLKNKRPEGKLWRVRLKRPEERISGSNCLSPEILCIMHITSRKHAINVF